jgi:hypothetical protein
MDDGWKTIIVVISGFLAIVLFYLQLVITLIFAMKNFKNNYFLKAYFLFLIYYFLFFIGCDILFLNLDITISLIFPLIFLFFALKQKHKNDSYFLKRYGFAILLAIFTSGLHLVRFYIYLYPDGFFKDFISSTIIYHPREFYWSPIYLISLMFFFAQIFTEIYYLYEKEKKKKL